MSVVGSFLTIDYRQLFTLKKQSYIHQTAEHQLYFLLLLTAFNRTAYGIEMRSNGKRFRRDHYTFNRTAYGIEIKPGAEKNRVLAQTFNRTAYGIEICQFELQTSCLGSFNRTAYGIEIEVGQDIRSSFVLLIAPLMELKSE